MNRQEFERAAHLEAQQRQAELEAQKGNPHFQVRYKEEVTEEEIRETAWNLCKEYDLSLRRRDQVLLVNFVSTELERRFGEEAENYFRDEWLNEVGLFCEKYGYA